jgi:hypothetical protein
MKISLRDPVDADLAIFFENQREPEGRLELGLRFSSDKRGENNMGC